MLNNIFGLNIYSVINTRKEFLLYWELEADDMALSNLWEVNAWRKQKRSRVSGTYNGKVLKVSRWPITSILALPSIVTPTTTVTTVEEIVANKELIADWSTWTWETLVNPDSVVAYEWPTESLQTIEWQKALLEWLQAAYVWTETAKEEEMTAIMTADPNDAVAVQEVSWWIVNRSIAPTSISSTLSSAIVSDAPCGEVFNGGTKNFWSINIASFAEWQSVCDNAKKTFTCNNGKWVDWLDFADTTTYIYSDCIVWIANNCEAIENYTHDWSIYNMPIIEHWVSKTITSENKIENNGTYTYDLTLDCANWTLENHNVSESTFVSCSSTYHTEDDQTCESDEKIVSCNQTWWPDNSDYTVENETITWNSETNLWNLATICAWTCLPSFHNDWSDLCVSDTKQTQCLQLIKPNNSEFDITNVNIQWNWSSWTQATECNWTCNQNYTSDWTNCIANTKQLACWWTIPDNASTTTSTSFTQTWSGTIWEPAVWTWWENNAYCDFDCNNNFHWDVDSCVADSPYIFDSTTWTITWYDYSIWWWDVVIPSSIDGIAVTAIWEKAFQMKGLKTIEIADSVKTIWANAFSVNSWLTSIVIWNWVETIWTSAFAANASLVSVTMWTSITSIWQSAFYNNSSLTSITIPSSVTEILGSAFSWCWLVNIDIPNSVTTLWDWAFQKNSITSFTFPNWLTKIPKSIFADNALTSITIPDNITVVDQMAFYNNSLTSITIPNWVTNIWPHAFANNNLTSITLPESITKIRSNAFVNQTWNLNGTVYWPATGTVFDTYTANTYTEFDKEDFPNYVAECVLPAIWNWTICETK